MFNISDYLKKFSKLVPPDEQLRKYTCALVYEELGVTLDKKDVTFRNRIIYINLPPVVKNEIYFKKALFLQKIRKFFDKIIVDDLR